MRKSYAAYDGLHRVLNLFTIFIFLNLFCEAQTLVPTGNVRGVWDNAGNPYILSGSITVAAGDTLRILPGVNIEIRSGSHNITVNGTLIAVGNFTDSIKIRGISAGFTSSDHGGSLYLNKNSATLDFIHFDNLGENYFTHDRGAVIVADTVQPTISNCSFKNIEAPYHIQAWAGGTINISNDNLITGIRSGYVVRDSRLIKTGTSSYYHLLGDLTVNSGNTLFMEPGADLRIFDGSHNITINGSLAAIGTTTDSIKITGITAGYTSSDHGGSLYLNNSTASIAFVHFNNLGENYYTHNRGAIIIADTAQPNISNCTFANIEAPYYIQSWAGGSINIFNNNIVIGIRSGNIVRDSRLIKTGINSYYRLLGDVVVNNAQMLVIEPGADLRIFDGGHNITVNGSLIAVGTTADSIYISGVSAGYTSSDHGGSIYLNKSSSTLAFIRFDNLGENYFTHDRGAIIIADTVQPIINNCLFTKTEAPYHIQSWAGGSVHISNNDLIVAIRSGGIVRDSRLIKMGAHSYYRLLGDLTVSNGQTLTLHPGTDLRIFDGGHNIIINGSLVAVGNVTDSIRITGISRGFTSSDHGGSLYLNRSTATLSFIHFDNLGENYFTHDRGAIIIADTVQPIIANCSFIDIEAPYQIQSWTGGTVGILNNNLITGIRSGNVIRDSRLIKTGSNSYYRLLGDLTVNSGSTLSMEPGTDLRIFNGDHDIRINGTLIAIGNFSDSIKITGVSAGYTSSDHGGSLYLNKSSSVLSYVHFNNLGENYFTNNRGVLIIADTVRPTINDCLFTNIEAPYHIQSWAGGNENIFNENTVIGIRPGLVLSNCFIPPAASNSFYNLYGDILVNTNVVFTIKPGVTLNFTEPLININVLGTLNANGSPLNPIRFTRLNSSGNNYGGSLNFSANSTAIIRNAIISRMGGGFQIPAIELSAGVTTQISNITVSENATYGILISGGSPLIDSSTIKNNPTGVRVSGGNPVFRNSNIFSNTSFGINNVSAVTSDTVDARLCWWGSSSGPTHITNPGGTGDRVSNRVKFQNFKSDSVFLRNQSISFAPVTGKAFGDEPFRLSASASSGLPINFSLISGSAILQNDTLIIMAAGNIIVEANQTGDSAYYPAAPVRQTIVINKALQEIVFNAVLDTNQVETRYYLIGTSSASLPVRFSIQSGNGMIVNDTLRFTGAGSVIVKASQEGNQNHLAASVQKTFCVSASNPGSISGLVKVCRSTQEYKITTAKGTISRWSLSSGGNLLNNTGDLVSINWTNVGTHSLTVISYSDCDTVNKQTKTIAVNVIDSLPLLAPANLFPYDNTTITNFPHNFSWRPVINATSYELFIWEVGTNQPGIATVSTINGISYSVRSTIIPGFAAGKQYNWLVKAKNGCTSSASQPIQFTVGNLPDLIVRTITIADSVFSGTTIDILVEIKNIGLAPTIPSLNWIDKFYLSADTLLDPFVRGGLPVDIELGGVRNLSALNPQESYTTTFRARLPRNAVGEYYIFVLVNSNQYGESDLQNNLVYKKFYIKLTEPPDLQVDSVFSRQDVFSGTSTELRFKVINPGKNATDNSQWKDDIFISPSPVFNIQEAIRLSSVTHQGLLMPDSSYWVTTRVMIPTRIFGAYYFHVYADASNNIYEYLYEGNNTKASAPVNIILTATPDFVVSQLSAPLTAVSGEAIAVNYTVRNDGANTPGIMETVWKDVVSVSTDSIFHRSNVILLGISSISNEQANLIYGASYHRVLNITIPALPSGKAYLYVNSDDANNVFEYLKENNNFQRLPIQINNPDLVISNPQIVNNLSSGQSGDVRWAIRNTGGGKVLPVEREDMVWLSASPVFNASTAVQIGKIAYNSLVDTASSIFQQSSVTIPDTVSGLRYVFIQTDYRNQIAEENENNNLSQAIPVAIALSPSPDLMVETVIVSSDTLIAERNYAINYIESNPGNSDIIGKSWKDRIFLSPSSQFNSNAVEIRNLTQARTLLATQSFTQTDSFAIPLSAFGNQDTLRRYVYVKANANDDIYEQNGTNNVTRSKELIIIHEPYPDLKVISATGSDILRAGASAYVQANIINQAGTAGLNGYWYDAVLFSRDTIPDAGDLVAATKVALAPFHSPVSYSTRINFTVPHGISGPYYMILVSDFTNLNSDKNRLNNYKVIRTRVGADSISVDVVLPPSSDLIPQSFTTPSVAYAGQAFQVVVKVVNPGPATTNKSSWKDKVYLSTDDQVDKDDIVLQTAVRTSALKKDSTYIDSLLIFLPSGIEGNYLLLFKADADNLVYEHNAEDNNVMSSAIFVMAQDSADLIVTDVTMPAQAFIGDSVTIFYRLRNQSTNVATGYIRQGYYSRPDDSLSSVDNGVLLASQMVQINLPSFADTLLQVKVKFLSESPNQNRIIVRTDLHNNLAENNETNNTTSSLSSINMQVPVLPINQLTPALLKNDQGLYYKIDVPDSLENGTLLIMLKGDSVLAKNELYVRFEKIPSRAAFDLAYENSSGAEKIIIIPELKKGTYYLLGYGISSSVNQQNITLLATPINFIVREVNASQGGNSGQVTVKVSGAKFTQGMTALLKNSSLGTIASTNIQYVNSLTAFVTFNLKGKQTGLYDFELVKPNNTTASLSNAFSVVPGDTMLVKGGNQVNGFYCYLKTDESDSLNVFVDYDGAVRIHVPFPMEIVYGNSGNIDIPIPQLLLKAVNGAPVGSSFSEVLFSSFASFLFELILNLIEQNGPQGILRPGARGSKRVFSMLPGAQQYRYRLIQN